MKVLREKEILDLLDKRSRDMIFKSILNHNRLRIPEGETESVAFFSKLLRDADKIDIYRVVTDYYGSVKSLSLLFRQCSFELVK